MSLHFVLDGYNLIKQDAKMSGLKLEAGRLALLKLIEKRGGSSRNKVTVVFDGKISGDDLQYASGLRVIFTSHESADDRIKTLVDEAENPKNIVVVTEDRDIRYYVRSLGARLMDPKEFLQTAGLQNKSGTKSDQAEKKDITYTSEGKITSEMAKIWLKGKK